MMKKITRYLAAAVLATGVVFCAHADLPAAASVTTNGVTMFYSSLTSAWADAIAYRGVDVLITMLEDATIESTLAHNNHGYGGILTLDLNGYVLAYAGAADACVISQSTGPGLNIIDTDTTRRTPHYFTCDSTGLWKLTNEVTERVVRGGLITGGRAGAVSIAWGSRTHVISNVNFVGNRSSQNGGAVSGTYGSLEISHSTFLGNVAEKDGGAVYATVPCTMTDCRVEANVADGLGGGTYLTRCGSLVRTEVVGNRAGTGGGVYLTFQTSSCFPADTRILMADGTEKTIESIAEGDVVRTFDHVGGTNSSAAVFYVYRGEGARDVFALSFASGATLEIVDRHDLLLETTRKYVTVSSDNACSYLGKRFYNYMTGGWDELTGVTQTKDRDAHYSIYTREHGNCVANGMLTVPDDKDCFVNIYELDDNLKADAERLAADIATYGLAEPADYPNIPLDDFVDGNIRYAFVAIGKGLTTQEELLFWNEFDYGPIVAKKVAPARRLLKGALKLATATPIPSPSEPYLRVGEGVVVTGNVSATETTDNVYLKPSVNSFGTKYNPVIDILPDATGIDVGVTLSTGTGIFGWTNAVNHAASFFADNPTYVVSYTADRVLALRAGIQVGGDAWATVGADGVCSITGTGDMWDMTAAKATPLWGFAITNVVVSDGVTKVGAHVFEKMATVKDVSLASSVTNVGVLAFHKCYLLTNVVSAATGTTSVGDGAFLRCNSLERLHFNGEASFGLEAYALQAGIRIVDGMPEIYPIPQIECSGYSQQLMGSNDLKIWQVITESQKLDYRFFKIVMERVD